MIGCLDTRSAAFEPEEVAVLSSAYARASHALGRVHELNADLRSHLAKLVVNLGRGRQRLGLSLDSEADAAQIAAQAIERLTRLRMLPATRLVPTGGSSSYALE